MDEQSNAVNQAEVADTSPAESAPVETSEPADDFAEVIDKELSAEVDDSDETEPDESDDQEPEGQESDDTQEVQEQETPEKETAANKRIRELVSRAKEAEEKAAQYEQYVQSLQAQQVQQAEPQQPQTVDDYLEQVNPDTGEYFTAQEAQIELMRSEMKQLKAERQQERHLAQVREQQASLASEVNRVLQDFPQFDANSDKFDQALSDRMESLLERNLIKDPYTGAIVGSHTPVYELYQTVSSAYGSGITQGGRAQGKATSEMMRRADHTAGGANISNETAESKFINSFFD